MPPTLHVVLHRPDIPQNAGNIGRTCVAVGAKLWFVRPMGFRLDDRYLKRAGMDYWQHLDWEVVDDISEVTERHPEANLWLVENGDNRTIWDASFRRGDILLFGSESKGLPERLMVQHKQQIVSLPMREEVRSLNLASTVNTVVYEAVRQWGGDVR
ncbi:tRNA (cytidine(34)-2'-O)-methyltransferase [Calycomorphotria hydatis]|uniref:Putative tRNA (cytidine(34)-2'-O)-methyltransferase n=1 Tax=Calycomorphotria hydatis TaxID=2528027 RepID=A0A517TAV1_9PLAN|nr:tRNA (cytidine(34)-2'-O)-methyltransferase [Calycomorphotria hydatis]QDT65494.1 tRNA (cytidine(34)-2'-O)-methyltransferase [Calycomorphotria hydatis]